MTTFDHLWETLCGWQDVKCQLLTNPLVMQCFRNPHCCYCCHWWWCYLYCYHCNSPEKPTLSLMLQGIAIYRAVEWKWRWLLYLYILLVYVIVITGVVVIYMLLLSVYHCCCFVVACIATSVTPQEYSGVPWDYTIQSCKIKMKVAVLVRFDSWA